MDDESGDDNRDEPITKLRIKLQTLS